MGREEFDKGLANLQMQLIKAIIITSMAIVKLLCNEILMAKMGSCNYK